MSLTGGNRNDVNQLLPLLDKIPAIAGRVGRPHRRPDALLTDRGYDHDVYSPPALARGIRPVIAKRGEPHGTGLGIFRYVVERTIAWLHGFRRLTHPLGETRRRPRSVPRTRRLCHHLPTRPTASSGTVSSRIDGGSESLVS